MRAITLAEVIETLVALRENTSPNASDEQLAFLNFCLLNIGVSASQYLQDLWVAYELKSRRGGYFVDFGGADGIKFSNSLALERHFDWTGIVAEPGRIWYPALPRNRDCFVDRRCVWKESGASLTFNQPDIALHSTIDSHSDNDLHADTRKDGKKYQVETVTLGDLLDFWNAPRRIDYLSIDTEGSELDILSAFDFASREIRLITVEHNHGDQRRPIFDLLTGKGYRRKFEKLSHVDDWYVLEY